MKQLIQIMQYSLAIFFIIYMIKLNLEIEKKLKKINNQQDMKKKCVWCKYEKKLYSYYKCKNCINSSNFEKK